VWSLPSPIGRLTPHGIALFRACAGILPLLLDVAEFQPGDVTEWLPKVCDCP
jgi:hypothetical protein